MSVRFPTALSDGWMLVGGGAAVGASLRWVVATGIESDGIPWATLAVNVVGCLGLGLLTGAPARWRRALGVGVCGGLTTFSTLSLELARFLDDGDVSTAASYVVASMALGVGGLVLGRRVAPW